MPRFLVHWLIAGLAVAIAARLLPGLSIRAVEALVLGGLLAGLANAVAAMLLQRSTLRLTPMNLAIALLALNTIAFGISAALQPTFPVEAMWQVGLGALLVTLVSWPIGLLRFQSAPDPA